MNDDFSEYIFRISNLTPKTLPMARLAKYVAALAKLFGEQDRVHFDAVRPGSVHIVITVEQVVEPVVASRVFNASMGTATGEAARAWNDLNDMLTDDRSTGTLVTPGAGVIAFPGAPPPEPTIGPVRQTTSVQGRLVRVEGKGPRVNVGLEDESGIAAGGIVVSVEMAKALGALFHRFVRLSGEGCWWRGTDGRWVLEQLVVSAFEPLTDDPIADALRRARALFPEGLDPEALTTVREIGRS